MIYSNYLKDERKISLSKFGLDGPIELDEIQLFSALKNKIGKKDEEDYETYRLKLKKCLENIHLQIRL